MVSEPVQEQALNAPQLRLMVCSPTTSCTCPVERLLQTIVRVVGYTWGWCEGEQDGAENGMFAKAHTGVGVYLFGGRGVLGPSSQRHPKGWGCPAFQKGCTKLYTPQQYVRMSISVSAPLLGTIALETL